MPGILIYLFEWTSLSLSLFLWLSTFVITRIFQFLLNKHIIPLEKAGSRSTMTAAITTLTDNLLYDFVVLLFCQSKQTLRVLSLPWLRLHSIARVTVARYSCIVQSFVCCIMRLMRSSHSFVLEIGIAVIVAVIPAVVIAAIVVCCFFILFSQVVVCLCVCCCYCYSMFVSRHSGLYATNDFQSLKTRALRRWFTANVTDY